MNKIKVKYHREQDMLEVFVARHGISGTVYVGPIGNIGGDISLEDLAWWGAAQWFVPLVDGLLTDMMEPIKSAVAKGRCDG